MLPDTNLNVTDGPKAAEDGPDGRPTGVQNRSNFKIEDVQASMLVSCGGRGPPPQLVWARYRTAIHGNERNERERKERRGTKRNVKGTKTERTKKNEKGTKRNEKGTKYMKKLDYKRRMRLPLKATEGRGIKLRLGESGSA